MRPARLALLLVGTLSLAGCYETHDDGTTLTVQFALWVRLLSAGVPLAFCAIMIALSLLPKKVDKTVRLVVRTLALATLALGLFPFACCAPIPWIDSIVISPDEFRRTTGFWFAPTRVTVRLHDIQTFRIAPRARRRGDVPAREWSADLVDGSTVRIPPGDLGKYAEDAVRKKLESLHVVVRVTRRPAARGPE